MSVGVLLASLACSAVDEAGEACAVRAIRERVLGPKQPTHCSDFACVMAEFRGGNSVAAVVDLGGLDSLEEEWFFSAGSGEPLHIVRHSYDPYNGIVPHQITEWTCATAELKPGCGDGFYNGTCWGCATDFELVRTCESN